VDSGRFEYVCCTNDVMPDEGRHYVTIFMQATVDTAAGCKEPENK